MSRRHKRQDRQNAKWIWGVLIALVCLTGVAHVIDSVREREREQAQQAKVATVGYDDDGAATRSVASDQDRRNQ